MKDLASEKENRKITIFHWGKLAISSAGSEWRHETPLYWAANGSVINLLFRVLRGEPTPTDSVSSVAYVREVWLPPPALSVVLPFSSLPASYAGEKKFRFPCKQLVFASFTALWENFISRRHRMRVGGWINVYTHVGVVSKSADAESKKFDLLAILRLTNEIKRKIRLRNLRRVSNVARFAMMESRSRNRPSTHALLTWNRLWL